MKKSRLLCALLACLAMAGCGAENTNTSTIIELAESTLSQAQTVVVQRGDMEVTVALDAWVGPKATQLTFPEKGRFGEFCVGIGEEVKKGDVLATSYLGDSKEQIEEEEEELEQLIADYEFSKAMYESNIRIVEISMDSLYEKVETVPYMSDMYTDICHQLGEMDTQKKRYELLLKQLTEKYELQRPYLEKKIQKLKADSSGNIIKAPYDGVVIALADVSSGTELDEQKDYVAIADLTALYVRCTYVSSNAINSIEGAVFWKDGMEYELAYVPMEEHAYRVMKNNNEDIYSEFELVNGGETISNGDYGKVILIAGHKEDVLMVPEVAIGSDSGQAFVYKDVDGKREKVEVKTGSKDGIYVEITEGLREGDVLYVQE